MSWEMKMGKARSHVSKISTMIHWDIEKKEIRNIIHILFCLTLLNSVFTLAIYTICVLFL